MKNGIYFIKIFIHIFLLWLYASNSEYFKNVLVSYLYYFFYRFQSCRYTSHQLCLKSVSFLQIPLSIPPFYLDSPIPSKILVILFLFSLASYLRFCCFLGLEIFPPVFAFEISTYLIQQLYHSNSYVFPCFVHHLHSCLKPAIWSQSFLKARPCPPHLFFLKLHIGLIAGLELMTLRPKPELGLRV